MVRTKDVKPNVVEAGGCPEPPGVILPFSKMELKSHVPARVQREDTVQAGLQDSDGIEMPPENPLTPV